MNWAVMQNEIICTFLFVSVILMVKGEHTAGDKKGVFAAICIAATLLGLIAGTNTIGACFNPAVSISLTIDALVRYWSTSVDTTYMTHYLYAYTLGPAIGAMLAGFFFIFHRKLHVPDEPIFDPKQHALVNTSDNV